ncbi:MAG: hypothetical protein LKH74_09310 [Levilactobacillus sp.]|jgi:hypothetical protein|nr:hypothetical protein [Levilactobacillus sp.]MCH4124058.1 hypothetical protein [Levilactobacillus sp.]MCI1554106.1 hypothetical protein [Levilactobacillus sp.]MCI1599944.1 hypothetical protein [Levilactobacillus sp.]MCI1606765.1 hypothetical protein [Levilactobacillus sp.]
MTTNSNYTDNKEFLTIPGAVHTDLYDGGVNHDLIPFAKLDSFFNQYLN